MRKANARAGGYPAVRHRKADALYMRLFRKQILFLCDSLILVSVTAVLALFSFRYSWLEDIVSQGLLVTHIALLLACTTAFQLFFRNYDSLWRYAEDREYLFLLASAFLGFLAYEILSRLDRKSVV